MQVSIQATAEDQQLTNNFYDGPAIRPSIPKREDTSLKDMLTNY